MKIKSFSKVVFSSLISIVLLTMLLFMNNNVSAIDNANKVGVVYIQVEDMIDTPKEEDFPAKRGVILEKQAVNLYDNDSMMDVFERAMEINKISYDNSGGTYMIKIAMAARVQF